MSDLNQHEQQQLAAACHYAARGWVVIPVNVPPPMDPRMTNEEQQKFELAAAKFAKTPRLPNGATGGSKDVKKVQEWWSGTHRGSNIGLVTGPSGLYIVDVDVKPLQPGGPAYDGHDSLPGGINSLRSALCIAKTPSGGTHYLFKGIPDTTAHTGVFPNVDIRTGNSYVVAAPSLTTRNRSYKWELYTEGELTDVPVDFLAAVTARTRSKPGRASTGVLVVSTVNLLVMHNPATDPALNPEQRPLTESIFNRCQEYLTTEAPPAIDGSRGHNTLLGVARELLYGFLMPVGVATKLAADFYNPRCSPPWAAEDSAGGFTGHGFTTAFNHKLKSVYDAGSLPIPGWRLTAEERPPCYNPDTRAIDPFLASLDASCGQSARGTAEAPAAVSAYTARGFQEMPVELTRPPGLVGSIVEYFNACGPRGPLPALNLGCALALMGTLLGRRYVDEFDTYPRLYAVGVAASGAGKETAMAKSRDLLFRLEAVKYLGAGNYTCDTAINNDLRIEPRRLFLMDEFGHILREMRETKSAGGLTVAPTLMILFTADKFSPKAKSGAAGTVIHNAHVNLYGVTTPARFNEGFSTQQAEDGLMGRLLFFRTEVIGRLDTNKIMNNDAARDRLVADLSHFVVNDISLADMGLTEETPADTQQKLFAEILADRKILVPTTDEASALIQRWNEEYWELRREEEHGKKDSAASAMYTRVVELTRRVALIVACGVNPEAPIIDEQVMDYSCRLVNYLTDDKLSVISNDVHESDYARDVNRIAGMIRDAGIAGIERKVLLNRVRKLKSKELDIVLNDLITCERIAVVAVKAANGTSVPRYFNLKNGAGK